MPSDPDSLYFGLDTTAAYPVATVRWVVQQPPPPDPWWQSDCAAGRAAMSQALDALESDADLDARRAAFERIQDEFDGVEGPSVLESQLATLKAAQGRLVAALENFGEHTNDCIRSRFDGGRPTKDGGYECSFAGTWYEAKPVDRTPPCDCGFSAALAAVSPDDAPPGEPDSGGSDG